MSEQEKLIAELREQVARIIDPMAAWDGVGWKHGFDSRDAAQQWAAGRQAEALTKAEAIHALYATALEGVMGEGEIYRRALLAISDVSTDFGAQDRAEEALQEVAALSTPPAIVGRDISSGVSVPAHVADATATGAQNSAGFGNISRYAEAVAAVVMSRTASVSHIQRALQCGFNEASRYIEMMESAGVVSPPQYDETAPYNAPTRTVRVPTLNPDQVKP